MVAKKYQNPKGGFRSVESARNFANRHKKK